MVFPSQVAVRFADKERSPTQITGAEGFLFDYIAVREAENPEAIRFAVQLIRHVHRLVAPQHA